MKPTLRLAALVTLLVLLSPSAYAIECVNRFLPRVEGAKKIVTLLTGKLTFKEAQTLAQAIKAGQAPPIEWVDEKGKPIAQAIGDLKVVRPMPVGCDGKTSGVVVVASFVATKAPAGKMSVKLDGKTPVLFEEQKD